MNFELCGVPVFPWEPPVIKPSVDPALVRWDRVSLKYLRDLRAAQLNQAWRGQRWLERRFPVSAEDLGR